MVKKEASKGREWEKGRRDVLNQTFCELHKALPSYDNGQIISKKNILIQALGYIQQLKQENKNGDVEGNQENKLEVLQKWTLHVLEKFSQLLSHIDRVNIKVPVDFLTLVAPPAWISPDITRSILKIEKFGGNNNVINKKQKIGSKRKHNTSVSTASAPSNGMASSVINTKVDKPTSVVKVAQYQNESSIPNSSQVANTSIIQSNPLIMQSPPLQMSSQLLFASNSSSTPLPLLVSVTGVKTVNPVILVQSNVVTPSPLSSQKVVSSGISNRPIQPGPPNRICKKLKKIPIPSLKQSGAHRNISIHCKNKLLKQSSKVDSKLGHQKIDRNNHVSKSIESVDSVPAKSIAPTDDNKLKSPMKNAVVETNSAVQKQPSNILLGAEGTCSESISDVNKENVAQNSMNSKGDSSNKDRASGTELLGTLENTKETPVAEDEEISSSQIGQQMKSNESSVQKLTDSVKTPVKKRLCEMDINTAIFKRQKCEMEDCSTDGSKIVKASATDCQVTHSSSVEVKASKSSYSILALCEGQQIFSENGLTSEATDQLAQDVSSRRDSERGSSKENTDVSQMGIITHQHAPIEKLNDACSNTEKSRHASSTNTYSEWSDKIKYKSDRICSSGNIFSSLPLHNNKNTFIPISDMENFKAVPESFDSADGSFGLPMHSSDISNDIFASLQVPTAGHHPESISPTAAFLLSFPLVSTSKATELLADDTVCENTDSQPGIKTILQIGNLDCDTPVTKCVTEFSSIEGSNVVYSASNIFSHDTVPLTISKNKSSYSSVENRNFALKEVEQISPHKCGNSGTLVPLKDNANFVHKHMEATIHESPCDSSKQNCLSRNQSSSSSLTSSGNSAQLDVSRLQSKQSGADGIANKASQTPNDSTPFLACEKQTDWIDIPHSTYSDFSTSSAPRSDCAANYVLPPVLMSSGTSVEESGPATKCQVSSSSSGIVSWSTFTPENIQAPKQISRLGHFQDIFPPSKPSTKSAELHTPDQGIGSSASSQGQVASTSMAVTKINTDVPNFEHNHQMMKLPNHGAKQSVSSVSFVLSAGSADLKKSFTISERKQDECGTLGVMSISSNVPSSNSTDRGRFNHPESEPSLRQQTSLSTSATVGYTVSEAKQSKTANIFFKDRSSKSQKSLTSITLENAGSKESNNLMNYNQNSAVSELKQSLGVPSYGHESINVKGNEMNNFHHQSNNPKLHATQNNEYPLAPSSTSKKNVNNFNISSDLSMDVAKTNTSGLNFNLESSTNMMQFSSNTVNALTNHQELYSNKSSEREGQLKSQQQCVRSTNKESVSNLHRPPVNWMTAPDIRSHQHHSGPSFGNNSNMNSTQGLLYLPDHTKESESTATLFDQSSTFHCLDISHSGQSFFKGNELHLFGNENVENFHDSSAWSPNKNGGSSMLGNMMIPSTLPTLVGDLALGDNNISRPFLPSYSNDPQSCHKKSVKRSLISSRRPEKPVEDSDATGQECGGSFLSVSQLVDTGNGSKPRTVSSTTKESNISYSGSFSNQDTTACQSLKQSSKPVSSNYSTEALLSSSNAEQVIQLNHRKRRSHSAHYSNNYVGGTVSYQNNPSVPLQAQGPQAQFLTDLTPHRPNDYQGTFLHSDGVHPFMIGNPPRTHRNQSYPLQNISDRPSVNDNLHVQKSHNSTGMTDTSVSRIHRTNINNSVNSTSTPSVSSNIIDFGYMNMPPPVSQDEVSFSNHPPAPPFLSHHSYPMPSQDTLYTTPRLTMHATNTSQNSTIQSPSATTLTNFHLSTIFPEINDKVIC